MKTFKIKLKTLSPIHIGTGLVIEPTEFFIDPKKRCLSVINFEKLCRHFTEEEITKFKKLCLSGNIRNLIELYKLTDQICERAISRGHEKEIVVKRIPAVSDFIQHYKSITEGGDVNLFNKFEIQRTYRLPNWGPPVIPGSSLKGAIRTAVLNFYAKKLEDRNLQKYRKGKRYDSRELEKEILGYKSPKDDPFSCVKVADLLPVRAKVCIVYAVNLKKDGSDASGPYQIFEVIAPNSEFTGKITITEKSICNLKIDMELILKALDAFYGKRYKEESEILGRIPEAEVPTFTEGHIIRLGKHSGAESVTIEGFRAITIRAKGKTRTGKEATTIWLASDARKGKNPKWLAPFGWATLDVE